MTEMHYVDSSGVDQLGYDPDAMELHVVFKGGAHYVYVNVPPGVYQELLDAASKGAYVNHEIRNTYSFRKE